MFNRDRMIEFPCIVYNTDKFDEDNAIETEGKVLLDIDSIIGINTRSETGTCEIMLGTSNSVITICLPYSNVIKILTEFVKNINSEDIITIPKFVESSTGNQLREIRIKIPFNTEGMNTQKILEGMRGVDKCNEEIIAILSGKTPDTLFPGTTPSSPEVPCEFCGTGKIVQCGERHYCELCDQDVKK